VNGRQRETFKSNLGSISSGQKKVLGKTMFRKLQDLIWIRHVGVPPKDTNMAAMEVG